MVFECCQCVKLAIKMVWIPAIFCLLLTSSISGKISSLFVMYLYLSRVVITQFYYRLKTILVFKFKYIQKADLPQSKKMRHERKLVN